MKLLKPETKLKLCRIEGKTEREILANLTDNERRYFTKIIRRSMPLAKFFSLSQNELNREIVLRIIISEACSDIEFFECIISKENADFIRRHSRYQGINEGQYINQLIKFRCAKDPKVRDFEKIRNMINEVKKNK